MNSLTRSMTTLLCAFLLTATGLSLTGCEKEVVTHSDAVEVEGDDVPTAVIIPNGLDNEVEDKEVIEPEVDADEAGWLADSKKDEDAQNAIITVFSEPFADELVGELKEMDAERLKLAATGRAVERVRFPYDSDKLGPNDKSTLKEAQAWLAAHPDEKLVLAGHADERGTKEYNEELAMERAEAVKAYLVKEGIPAERLMTISYGESVPQVDAQTKRAYRLNRRVTLKKDSTDALGIYEIPEFERVPKTED